MNHLIRFVSENVIVIAQEVCVGLVPISIKRNSRPWTYLESESGKTGIVGALLKLLSDLMVWPRIGEVLCGISHSTRKSLVTKVPC